MVPVHRPSGTHLFVECLEDVFSVNEAEEDHDFVHQPLQLLFSGLLVTRAELSVDVFRCGGRKGQLDTYHPLMTQGHEQRITSKDRVT